MSDFRVEHGSLEDSASFDGLGAPVAYDNDGDSTVRLGSLNARTSSGMFRNVMLIRRVDEEFERVAIAQLSGAAWMEAQPTQLLVSLR